MAKIKLTKSAVDAAQPQAQPVKNIRQKPAGAAVCAKAAETSDSWCNTPTPPQDISGYPMV